VRLSEKQKIYLKINNLEYFLANFFNPRLALGAVLAF